MQLKDFQKALEHRVDLLLPDEPKVFNAANNSGKPLAQTHARAKVVKALRKMAGEIPLPEKKAQDPKVKGKANAKGKPNGKPKAKAGKKSGLFGLFSRG
jgi:Flp pilus assembly CpaE family ATPase